MAATLENPYILLVNKKLLSIKDLLPVLEQVHQSSRPLLIVADDIAAFQDIFCHHKHTLIWRCYSGRLLSQKGETSAMS